MYGAVTGGETAILNSYRLQVERCRGAATEPELSGAHIRAQMRLAVDWVSGHGQCDRHGVIARSQNPDLILKLATVRSFDHAIDR